MATLNIVKNIEVDIDVTIEEVDGGLEIVASYENDDDTVDVILARIDKDGVLTLADESDLEDSIFKLS